MWLITNINDLSLPGKSLIKCIGFSVYHDCESRQDNASNGFSRLTGYLLATNDSPQNIKILIREGKFIDLPKTGPDYRSYLKGNFSLVTAGNDWFCVDGDRFGIQKWFYWVKEDKFIVSDSLSAIRTILNPDPSVEAMALYALTYHFTAGTTILNGVLHNTPAQYISFTQSKLSIGKYWDPMDLLKEQARDITIGDIVDNLSAHVLELLELYKGNVSLSLTGGADTRNILSIMLRNGVKPHLYTYGDPRSTDCMKAAAIAKGLKLDHTVHDIKMSPQVFSDYGRKIIKWGQSLTSIHRAHRIIAVEREAENCDLMFLGTLGGEFVKGVGEDDYIIPSIVYDTWDHSLNSMSLQQKANNKGLVESSFDISTLLSLMNSEPYFQSTPTVRKMASLCYITAHLHDAQDIILYQYPMKKVYTPFLDVDYLKLLFSSKHAFNSKEVIINPIKRRVANPIYASQFISASYPELGRYRYCGEHKPNEVLFNPYTAALLKGLRQKLSKPDPANFPLGDWMKAFIEMEHAEIKDSPMLKSIFDMKGLSRCLKDDPYKPKESYLLKYTNPIFMKYILDNL